MSAPDQTLRYCPNCGARATPGVAYCPSCGQSLAAREEMARLWGVDATTPPDESSIIDLYPESPSSLQATTPFTQTRPFQPDERKRAAVDPWSSAGGTLSQKSSAPPPPPPAPVTGSQAKPGGPHGCVLGCLALLIIGAVAALLLWGAVRPLVSDRVSNEISIGLTNELRQIDNVPMPATGRITLTDAQINDDLTRNSNEYEPIERAVVTIGADEIAITFELYGIESTYRSGLTVENGRLTVVDPSLSGAASRIIDADEIGSVFEREVAELLRRSNATPDSVRLRDGSIVLTVRPTA